MRAYAVSEYRVITLIILALIWAKSALERLAFQLNVQFTALCFKYSSGQSTIFDNNYNNAATAVLIYNETCHFVGYAFRRSPVGVLHRSINRKLNCLHLITEKIRYFDLPDQTICSLQQPKISLTLLE